MEIKFELNEVQEAALNEVLMKLPKAMSASEFCKKATIGILIQNKQTMIAEELNK